MARGILGDERESALRCATAHLAPSLRMRGYTADAIGAYRQATGERHVRRWSAAHSALTFPDESGRPAGFVSLYEP